MCKQHHTHHTTLQHTTTTTTAYVPKDQEGASPRVSYTHTHRLRPSHFTTPRREPGNGNNRELAPAASSRSSLRPTYPPIDRNETRDGINFGIHFSSFLFNGHPGEDINDYDHHGGPTGWAGLGWIGSDFGLVWFGLGVWIICSRGMNASDG